MNAHDMLPSDSEPDWENHNRSLDKWRNKPDACTCASCSRHSHNPKTCFDDGCPHCTDAGELVPFKITGPGLYKTRDGRKAVVTEIINNRAFGRFESPLRSNYWSAQHWNLDGQEHKYTQIHLDIISLWTEYDEARTKPRKPVEGWVNVYSQAPHNGVLWATKIDALQNRGESYIATVKVQEVPSA